MLCSCVKIIIIIIRTNKGENEWKVEKDNWVWNWLVARSTTNNRKKILQVLFFGVNKTIHFGIILEGMMKKMSEWEREKLLFRVFVVLFSASPHYYFIWYCPRFVRNSCFICLAKRQRTNWLGGRWHEIWNKISKSWQLSHCHSCSRFHSAFSSSFSHRTTKFIIFLLVAAASAFTK
jgi:hypothetical protein